jgi:hypothetical protein
MIKATVLVLLLLATVAVFVPIGVYLQWSVPRDVGLCRCAYPLLSFPILAAALALYRRRGAQWPMRAAALSLFLLFGLVLITLSLPPISRRVGPWAPLRGLLVAKSRQVTQARAELAIPEGRDLTSAEMRQIEGIVLEPPPTYTFPIIGQTVQVRMMSLAPPYVGLDFGGGRRAVFDLATMVILYAD